MRQCFHYHKWYPQECYDSAATSREPEIAKLQGITKLQSLANLFQLGRASREASSRAGAATYVYSSDDTPNAWEDLASAEAEWRESRTAMEGISSPHDGQRELRS